jgi:glycosyltransferase involved in cell wall biosynthesis
MAETVTGRKADILDCQLLETSGILDARAYRAASGVPAGTNPISDYLGRGWQTGIEPSPTLECNWLYPYYASAGLTAPPALTYLALKAAQFPVYPRRAAAERVASAVRASGLFDERPYAALAGLTDDLDPALHYVVIGERIGLAPSKRFDPEYYGRRYPDLLSARDCLLVHYAAFGAHEGRRPVSLAAEMKLETRSIDPQHETVLVVAHEATRTGAPILAYNIAKRLREKYNVVSLLLESGPIVSAFESVSNAVVGPLRRQDGTPLEAEYLVRRLNQTFRISYVIANSIDTRIVMKPFVCACVPVVALVHEFASYLPTKGEMGRQLEWASDTVFSAERVAASARADYPNLDNGRIHVLPQGPPELPPAPERKEIEQERKSLRAAMRPPGSENDFVVLGCGTIYPRKGVDLFVSCATAIAAQAPQRRIRFVWIGQRLPDDLDKGYFPKLLRQIERAGLGNTVTIVHEVADLEPAYETADAFFLSSRLDPLPNVAIDTALRGLPIICFQDCSGIADILLTDTTAREGVVPSLDADAAAAAILRLAADDTMRKQAGAACGALAERTFDMARYIAQLDDIGQNAARIMEQRRDDFTTIDQDESFDTVGYLGPDSELPTREAAIRLFLAKAAVLGATQQPTKNYYYRRPCPGFHPQIYAHENRNRYDASVVNPLAHYIRSGKPAGPWSHEVITPDSIDRATTDRAQPRTAIHVHFHYPELCGELLDLIAVNRAGADLLLTTNSSDKAKLLEQATADYDRGKVLIRQVPNRGRDIGPFVTALGESILENYDLIGHLHSKRSLRLSDRLIGERWRGFMWQNLVGGQDPMMDVAIDRMMKKPTLGLVFPDEPHLSDWDHNLPIAEQLARRMGMRLPLQPFFDFPVGTMFWARSAALGPLFKLGLTWDDYPQEPVPEDGTILHALERLLPFVARHTGYSYATTHVPGVTW